MFLMNIKKEIFHIENALQELISFVKINRFHRYELIVGSDSKRKGLRTTHITVVFLWDLETRKFKLFYNKERTKHTGYLDLATRIIQETTRSLEYVSYIENSELVGLIGRENFEVHIDAGYGGKSKKVIPTVTGIIKGSGLKYKIKPDSWVASAVADRLVKRSVKREDIIPL
jgi:hypothetical protein